jgi:hypothetical protein
MAYERLAQTDIANLNSAVVTLASAPPPSGGSGTTVKVAGADFTINTNTLTDITGLTFAATANTKYEFDALLLFQTGSASGVQVSVAFSGAGASSSFMAIGNGGSSGFVSNAASGLGTGLGTFGTASATYITVNIKGHLIVGANAGNLTIQMARLTSGTTTVYVGSRLTVTAL